ncbi:hypothetical protein [Halorientalis halophila]|uniref:hypothetical protein n=1 Tax=Halorientalis halophila TaxID=3108499 RepID=UPI003009081A
MEGTVSEAETATELAEAYADEHCVGELGDVLDVERAEGVWVVEFRTHTYADAYDHRVRITTEGDVFGHERLDRSS